MSGFSGAAESLRMGVKAVVTFNRKSAGPIKKGWCHEHSLNGGDENQPALQQHTLRYADLAFMLNLFGPTIRALDARLG